ncbi:MAG: leucyl aminopeptidase, partial [Paracoccaceae bacterium]|nr:leucyl aminopeptidase [Paracoccaceae bacterium]
MTDPVRIHAALSDIEPLSSLKGRIALLVDSPEALDVAARRVNRLTRGALARMLASDRFAKLKTGEVMTLAYPAGMEAEAVDVVRLSRRADAVQSRKAGVALAKLKGRAAVTVMAGGHRFAAELGLGLALRAYSYDAMKSGPKNIGGAGPGDVTLMVSKPDEVEAALVPLRAIVEGVFLTRNLISAPANILTTTTFAEQLLALRDLGVEVEVLEEADLEKLGMGSLLSVGHGSESPSKVVVMQWKGGAKDAAPLALVGKGVVFDTGGYSLKPAGGMEDMTMDMGGAGVVAGVMHTLAKRGARANVVGLVGLVENMISGRSTRPGDVVRSMKGD